MSETRWWWIRHAPVTGHEGRVYGASEVPCDVSARDVFQRLAGRLPADALWVTSHLQRTSQTAEAIRTEMSPEQAATPLPVARLAEQNFGDWQGMSRADLAERRDGAWHRFWLAPAHERPPGGESFEDVVERVSKSITELTEQHRGRDIIAVTHGGTIRAALAFALEIAPERALAFEIANCSLTRLDFVPGSIGSHHPSTWGAWRVGQVNLAP